MDRIRDFLKKNPIAGWAVVLALVAAAGYLLASRLFGMGGVPPAAAPPSAPPAAVAPSPAPAPTAPAATPAPAPAAQPAPAPPVVAPKATVPPGPVGRADPFLPVVRDPGSSPGPTPPPPPPGTTLPPPPFPTPGGQQLPPPPLPGGGVAPLQPGGALAVTGIVGNSESVAIIVVGGKTEIVGAGDELGDLRVVRIDPIRRTVTFLQAGKRFDVRMGGE